MYAQKCSSKLKEKGRKYVKMQCENPQDLATLQPGRGSRLLAMQLHLYSI
jgi:hypothetical protein